MSDNAATDGGGVRLDNMGRGERWRVGGRVQFLVVGETRRAYCVVKRSCCIVGGVVVVVAVEERIFARAIKVGAGADASRGVRWSRHVYDWGDSGALLKGAVK